MAFATPGFLWAGAVLAAVAVGVHLLTRRPPDALPLPTARFLRHEPRTLVRLRRWPADVPLLLARMAFALCLAAAFAGPTWAPARSGSAHVILLEAGAGAGARWPEMVAAARAAGSVPAEVRSAPEGAGEAVVVVAYGTDDDPVLLRGDALADLDGMRPGTGAASFEDGLRALRSALVERTTLAEARVTWVARPVWEGWTPGVGLLRTALWPGRVAVWWVDGAEGGPDGGPAGGSGAVVGEPPGAGADRPRPVARVPAGAGGLGRALAALGAEVVGPAEDDGAGPDVVGAPGGAGGSAEAPAPTWFFRGAAAAGAVGEEAVRPSGRADVTTVTWSASGSVPAGPVRMAGGASVALGVAGAGSPPAPVDVEGRPRTGLVPASARVVATAASGRPVAWRWRDEGGCRIHTSVRLDGPDAAASPSFPRFLAGLLGPCAAPARGEPDLQPLDAGARAVLETGIDSAAAARGAPVDGGAAPVDVAALAAGAGRPLAAWFLAAALLLLAVDVALGRRRPS